MLHYTKNVWNYFKRGIGKQTEVWSQKGDEHFLPTKIACVRVIQNLALSSQHIKTNTVSALPGPDADSYWQCGKKSVLGNSPVEIPITPPGRMSNSASFSHLIVLSF
mmetsp:Transcript_20894/g.30097  ORF Transcript_20894/g.30097 Transcript_20894/m.30097 type:complete len:107 (-) Transcript_20894:486-806(-)